MHPKPQGSAPLDRHPQPQGSAPHSQPQDAASPDQPQPAAPHPQRRSPKGYRAMFLLAVILFATALFLTADNMYQSSIAGESARRVLAQIAEKNPAMADPTTPAMAMPANPAAPMPTTRVNGIDYLGTLVIPSLDLELPIAAECDDERLRVSPCCYAGNYMADDLVICGEGYASHFGRIGLLGIADKARLVTPDGTVIPYIVSNVEIDREDEIDAIMDDWDLTLFTFNMDDTVQVVRLIRA